MSVLGGSRNGKIALLTLPLIMIMTLGGIYISLDNHYSITLTPEFTASTTSDKNNFGIILSNTPTNQTIGLDELTYYKKIIIPYNSSSGQIDVKVSESRDDRIIGFMNEQTNSTNSTTTTIRSVSYTLQQDYDQVLNQTEYINSYNRINDSIDETRFSANIGYMNYSQDYINMIFDSPTLDWKNLSFSHWYNENWTPTSDLIGKTIDKLYIPFRWSDGIVKNGGFMYGEVYNDTEVLSTIGFDSFDFYSPYYSVLNILSHPISIYGTIIIKLFTSESYSNDTFNLQVGLANPKNTDSNITEFTMLLGVPSSIIDTTVCYYKGIVLHQQILNTTIVDQNNGSENQIDFNLTIPLHDYGITPLNMVSLSLHIDDLYHTLPVDRIVDGLVMFYNFNASQFYNFAFGDIQNRTYSINYGDNSEWFSPNYEIVSRILLRGHDNDNFTMILRNVWFDARYIEVSNITTYYMNYTVQLNGVLQTARTIYTQTISQEFGFTYEEILNQSTYLYLNLTLDTPLYRVENEIVIQIDDTTTRNVVYYIKNELTDSAYNIQLNSFDPIIIVRPYIDGIIRKVDYTDYTATVYI